MYSDKSTKKAVYTRRGWFPRTRSCKSINLAVLQCRGCFVEFVQVLTVAASFHCPLQDWHPWEDPPDSPQGQCSPSSRPPPPGPAGRKLVLCTVHVYSYLPDLLPIAHVVMELLGGGVTGLEGWPGQVHLDGEELDAVKQLVTIQVELGQVCHQSPKLKYF